MALVSLACGGSTHGKSLLARGAQPTQVEPLVVRNPGDRYFTGARTGRTVYLTGSHTWNNFQDWDAASPPRPFDFERYLDFLEGHGHNLIRLYVWEQAAWFPGDEADVRITPLPYLRTGPGLALDGGPRFDLHRLDPAYFARLRERVARAGARGIYVSVMLFNGWSVESKGKQPGNPWRGHPFNRENNVDGIDGDVNGDGEGKEVHTLDLPAVTALQKAYLAKVVETLRDQENVLFEISNESDPDSIAWQYEMIRTIRELEVSQPLKHPVGMTAPFPTHSRGNAPLLESGADWISPEVDPKDGEDPEPARGEKVILSDTDHIWGIGGSPGWAWKTLLRGANPTFMDPCVTAIRGGFPTWPAGVAANPLPAPCPPSEFESVRQAMGFTRALADRVDLARLRPATDLCSTHYCLADAGREYLVYAPLVHRHRRELLGALSTSLAGEAFELDLTGVAGRVDLEWVDAETGEVVPGQPVAGGHLTELRAPFAADAVLHARVEARP